jgi:hypothetical protein
METEYSITPSKKPSVQPIVESSHSVSTRQVIRSSNAALPTPPTTVQSTQSTATVLPATIPSFSLSGLPQDLGKCIANDVALLHKLGWRRFVAAKRHRKDLAEMHFNHPARRLLLTYKNRGVPAKVTTPAWTLCCL